MTWLFHKSHQFDWCDSKRVKLKNKFGSFLVFFKKKSLAVAWASGGRDWPTGLVWEQIDKICYDLWPMEPMFLFHSRMFLFFYMRYLEPTPNFLRYISRNQDNNIWNFMLFQWWKRVVFENKRIYINNTAVQDGLVHIGNKIDFSQKKETIFSRTIAKLITTSNPTQKKSFVS
jgi:hypothetical protein